MEFLTFRFWSLRGARTLRDDAFLVGRLRGQVEAADVVRRDVDHVDRLDHVAQLADGVLGERRHVEPLQVDQRFEDLGAEFLLGRVE